MLPRLFKIVNNYFINKASSDLTKKHSNKITSFILDILLCTLSYYESLIVLFFFKKKPFLSYSMNNIWENE